jgi:HK97 family phage prohead protease
MIMTEQPLHLEATGLQFRVDTESRTISGLAVPYGVVGDNGHGRYTFSAGTLSWPRDLSRVKLLIDHNFSRAVGHAAELTDTAVGLLARFKVARGAAGDEALTMAADHVLDGLSVGLGRGGKFRSVKDATGPLLTAVSAPVIEISLTPLPAFDDARVTAVAASAAGAGDDTARRHVAAAILLS